MTRRVPLAAGVLILMAAASAWADEVPIRGKIDAVTVYRGQALVSRVIDLPDATGLADIVVTDLPPQVLPASVFAEVEGDAEVRHIRPRTRAVMDDVQEGVRKIDEQLAELEVASNAERARLDVVTRHGQYLDKLEGFTAPTANVELTRGVLNAETLQKLTQFLLEQRKTVAKETLEANAKLAELGKQTELLRRQRAEVTGGASKTAREAVLMVDVKKPGAKVRLKYLVNNASWSPTYTLRARTGSPDVQVHYQATVSQLSGEDWGDVRMTLSTATPSVVARAPTLEPLQIALGRGEPALQMQQQAASPEYGKQLAQKRALADQNFMANSGMKELESQPGGGSADFKAGDRFAGVGRDNVYALNRAAGELQQAELVLDNSVVADARAEPTQTVSVTYTLPGTTSLPSRADQQLVGIATATVHGEFYKVASPVLTNYVYNEAELSNDGKQLLLAGPTMSYLDGEFVGTGELPTVAAGEQFAVGFGVDAALRATRELVDKSESISGGNKIIQFQYAIRLENFGSGDAKVRVLDRVPVAANKDVKVTLGESSPRPVDDAEGLRKRGLVRWDVTVRPQATQPTTLTASAATQPTPTGATTVRYALTIEHDRNLSVIGAK
jgi:hypothetical protein